MNTKIATHEAGHAIVADALGFGALHCKPIDGGFVVMHEGPDDPTPLECFHLAVVACAGCCAQEARAQGYHDFYDNVVCPYVLRSAEYCRWCEGWVLAASEAAAIPKLPQDYRHLLQPMDNARD